MSDLKSEEALFRYYCTAGNGMERFLMDEVKVKLAAEDVCHMPGKVLFSSSAGINRVSELKAAERLFLLLRQDAPVRLSAHTSPAKAASVLQSRLLGDADEWRKAVMTWSRLQGELAVRRSTVKAPSAARTVTWKREEENKHDVESRKSTEGQNEESGDGRLRSDEQNREYIPAKKKKIEKEQQEVRDVERKRKRDDDEEKEKGEERRSADFNCRDNATQILDHNVESSRRTMDNLAQDFSQSVENAKTSEEGDKTLMKTSRIKPEPSSVPVSFRISCKCTGSLSRYFSTQEVNKVIGVGLSRLLGWRADLKNPLLEVHVYLSDDHCLLGIPLTRLPLANRSYIKTTGLRSTVAWAMASLAQIQPGFCVVDPMCGVGTILIEAAQEHKAACFLGMDIDDGQLQRANDNIEFAELENRIHLLKASSMALPLPSASIDTVVCDLPFGRKFGTKTNMATNLPLILTEMERVLRTGGILVLLLSPQLSCQLKKLLAQTDTGRTTNPEKKLQTGIQDSPSPSLSSTQQQAFQTHQEVKSPPTQKTDPQSAMQHAPPLPLSSLKHEATHRVSLGVIDGLIHKYVKMDT